MVDPAKDTLDPAKDNNQAPTNRLKLYVMTIIESEAWPTVVQLRGNHSYKRMRTVAWYPCCIPLFITFNNVFKLITKTILQIEEQN